MIEASIFLLMFAIQYGNEANPRVHYEETTEEIIEQCEGKLDMIVIGVGTGWSFAN